MHNIFCISFYFPNNLSLLSTITMINTLKTIAASQKFKNLYYVWIYDILPIVKFQPLAHVSTTWYQNSTTTDKKCRCI